MILCGVCVSLPDLLHLGRSSLGPSMLLRMALFCSFLGLSSTPLCVSTCACTHAHMYSRRHTHIPCIFSIHSSFDGHPLTCLGYCEECRCEHRRAHTCVHTHAHARTHTHTLHLLHSFLLMDIHWHVWSIVKSAAVSIGVHVPFQVTALSGCVSRSGGSGPCGSSSCSFLRTLSSVPTVAARWHSHHTLCILSSVDGHWIASTSHRCEQRCCAHEGVGIFLN